MGICVGKCAHLCASQERQLLACCGKKVTEGLEDSDTTKLLVFDVEENGQIVRSDARAADGFFGYNIISQNDTATPRLEGRIEADSSASVTDSLPYIERRFLTGNGDRFSQLQPQTANLDVYVVTWNMNGKPFVGDISTLLESDGVYYDLYVIGLQEAHHSVAESILNDALGKKYSLVAVAVMMSLQLFVIAKKSILPFLSKPLVDKVSVGGLGGVVGRQKGAVAVALRYKGASLLFIACHLAPHEGNVGERNAQFHRIYQTIFSKQSQAETRVCSGCSCIRNAAVADEPGPCMDHALRSNFIEQSDIVVWLGDLNYRVEMSRNSVSFLISHKFEEVLWARDQLSRALKKGQAFNGFKEGPLLFKPTYKFDVGTDNYDSSHKERVPSWTDRILYKVGSSSDMRVHVMGYNSINSIRTSDHRPVKALLSLSNIKEKIARQ